MIVRSPTLAAISLEPTGGGVAGVARLLWDVFERQWGADARLLTLIESGRTHPSFAEKTRYALRLARAQAMQSTDSILFSHLGLAKPLQGMPRTWHRPYGVFVHGVEAWNALPGEQLELLARAELRIANSAYTARRVMDAHPEVGPVVPCPLALPPERVRTEIAQSGSSLPPLGEHAVLVVGRMLGSERYKGHDELIDAWPRVLADVPDAQLVLVGLGDDRERLRDKAARGPARHAILFTGFVPRPLLEQLYERAACLALPSRGEGFGLVYLEAMAHRRACIGSIHDAARDVIVDGQTGRLVDQDDLDSLAGAVVGLLKNPDEQRRMGEEGYRRLQEHFSFDSFMTRFNALMSSPREALAS